LCKGNGFDLFLSKWNSSTAFFGKEDLIFFADRKKKEGGRGSVPIVAIRVRSHYGSKKLGKKKKRSCARK